MHFKRILLFILLWILPHEIDSLNWDYGKLGPDAWSKEVDPTCGGQSQSPINIQTACTIYQTFEPFRFATIHNDQLSFTLTNDGHAITATYDGPTLTLTGGDLNGTFQFVNIHFHWGPNQYVGSEHQVNGDKYSGENHFVYMNIETQQYAVLSFLMQSEANTTDNLSDTATMNEWRHYFDAVQQLTEENDSSTIELNLTSLMGSSLTDFWRYNGSLTVPPCTEGVIWTVFKQPIFVSDYLLETLRDRLFLVNYRDPQPLYNRRVYQSFLNETLSPIPDQNCCVNTKSEATSFPIYSRSFFLIFLLLFHRLFCSI